MWAASHWTFRARPTLFTIDIWGVGGGFTFLLVQTFLVNILNFFNIHMRYLVKQSFNPEKGKRNDSHDQADIRDVFNSPERLKAEELSIAQDSYIPMTSTNTSPTPEEQNPVMKAVVGGSAADIIKAMQQRQQQMQQQQ